MDISNLVQIASNDGVSRAEDLPFLLQASSPAPAVILVHGFSASPREMRLLAESLHRQGMTCLAVRLPGHATSPEDLALKKWEDWLECVDSAYEQLSRSYSRIFAVGLSTGCLILLALALRKKLAGLVLCSPYLRIQHFLAPHAWWLRHIRRFHPSPRQTPEYYGYYHKRPVAGVHQINRLVRHLKKNLTEITVPVLAMNGEGDKTIDIESGRWLYDKLGSQAKIYFRFGPDTPHVMIQQGSSGYETVFELSARFISGLDQAG